MADGRGLRMRREEHRAKNLFYDQVYRLMVFLGAALLVAFTLQIYTLKIEGKTDRAVRREMMSEIVVDENGQEYKVTAYQAPTADVQDDYWMHEVSGFWRKLSGALFTKFYHNTGWRAVIVNDITLRWLWILAVVVIFLVLRLIIKIKVTKLVARQGRGEVDSLAVKNFKPLYHDRFIKYLVVMSLAIAGPVKHAIFWPVIGAVYVTLAEFWYMGKLVMITNPPSPQSFKKHWWVRLTVRVVTITGWRNWRESKFRIVRVVGKIIFIIVFVVTWPFRSLWRKFDKVILAGGEEYGRRQSED